MVEEDNQSLHNENNENNHVRTFRDYMNPTKTSAPSCIVFPPDASHFNFKPDIIQLLPSFHDLDLENPYLHLREFGEVSNTYNDSNCRMNTIRLNLFPFLLKDKAKTWLQNLRPGSIRTWDEMQQQFLKKFLPSHITNSFKRQITTFTQKPGETFYQYWDKCRDLLNTCPHHGFETWRLVSHFYEGLTLKDSQMVELMCNGTFEDKDPDEAMEYLDLLAENTREHTTLVGEIIQISVGRVITIMHKLHSHHFKHTIISKILMDIHLFMLHLLEEILRKHCMHSLKSRR